MRKLLIKAAALHASRAFQEAGLTAAEKRLVIGRLFLSEFTWNAAPTDDSGESKIYAHMHDLLMMPETEAELRHRQGDDRDEDPTEPAVEADDEAA